jgi:hypothetical protein
MREPLADTRTVDRRNLNSPYPSLASRNISFNPSENQLEELEKLQMEHKQNPNLFKLEQLDNPSDYSRREVARVYGEQYNEFQRLLQANQLTAGSGVTIVDNEISVDPSQINDIGTLDSLTVTGAADFSGDTFSVSGAATFSGVITVPSPTNGTDATTKTYVDGTVVTAGTGLTKTGNAFSVNAAQTGVTSLGTLTGLNVNGDVSVAGFVYTGVQYNVPIEGDTVSATAETIILNPSAALTALTIVFPNSPSDGQKLTITSSQNVSALTATASFANGNEPSAGLTAGSPLKYVWSQDAAVWFAA